MRFKSAMILAALLLLTFAAIHARPQTQQKEGQKDEKVIEDFVTTRGVIFETVKPTPAKTPTRRRQGSSVASTKKNTPSGTKQGTGAAGTSEVARQQNANDAPDTGVGETPTSGGTDGSVQFIKASTMRSLALGYTIYMKDTSGSLMPVQASRSYKTGDRIALILETNADGYLYVFDAENGKNPMMLYPNVQLNGGANDVRAHVRETYPADLDLAFEFVDPPASEHVFIVFSRDPIAGIPVGDALEKFCAKNRDDCYYRPTATQWARISAAALDKRIIEARSTQIAQADTQPVMPAMLQRGIKLKKEEPAPAIVRVSDSPATRMLVTKIELAHN